MLRCNVNYELQCVRRDSEFGKDGGSVRDRQAIHLTIRGMEGNKSLKLLRLSEVKQQ
jgi:hypothetical protein